MGVFSFKACNKNVKEPNKIHQIQQDISVIICSFQDREKSCKENPKKFFPKKWRIYKYVWSFSTLSYYYG